MGVLDSRLRGNGDRGFGNDIEGTGITDACSSFDRLRANGRKAVKLVMTEVDSPFDKLRTNGNMRLRANGRKRNIVMICIIISLI